MVHRNIPHITLCLDNVRRNLKSELDGQYGELYICHPFKNSFARRIRFFFFFYYLIIDRRWIDFHNAVWIFQFYFYIASALRPLLDFRIYIQTSRDLTSWYTNKTITSFFRLFISIECCYIMVLETWTETIIDYPLPVLKVLFS